jgi:sec-independent protein translocase protein TatA
MFDTHATVTLGFIFQGFGMWEAIVLALLGVLIFGKRLPEVGKSIGKGIVEFKKGLSGIEDDIDLAAKQPPKIEQHANTTTDSNNTSEKPESNNQSS